MDELKKDEREDGSAKDLPGWELDQTVTSELDRAIARRLVAVGPAAGFADRVLARVEQPQPQPQPQSQPQPVLAWPAGSPVRARLPRWGTWAAGLALACALGEGGHVWLEHRQAQELEAREMQAQLAEQQFNQAMRVTDRALEKTRERLLRAGVQLTD